MGGPLERCRPSGTFRATQDWGHRRAQPPPPMANAPPAGCTSPEGPQAHKPRRPIRLHLLPLGLLVEAAPQAERGQARVHRGCAVHQLRLVAALHRWRAHELSRGGGRGSQEGRGLTRRTPCSACDPPSPSPPPAPACLLVVAVEGQQSGARQPARLQERTGFAVSSACPPRRGAGTRGRSQRRCIPSPSPQPTSPAPLCLP